MIVEFLIGATVGFIVSLQNEELKIRRNQNTILTDIKNIYNEELQLQRNQNTIFTDIRDKLCKFDTDNK
jgi:hypothetical protein